MEREKMTHSVLACDKSTCVKRNEHACNRNHCNQTFYLKKDNAIIVCYNYVAESALFKF